MPGQKIRHTDVHCPTGACICVPISDHSRKRITQEIVRFLLLLILFRKREKRMKVGIMTFPHSVSYGCVLQMYALQQTVAKLGHEAEVIHYQNEYMKQEKHMTRTAGKPSVKESVRKMARRILHLRLYRAFAAFEKRHIALNPKKPFGDRQTLEQLGRRYDAVICGSDQVWNPDITGRDLAYFLDFCGENTRRVAYAASFGIENFSEDFRQSI